MKLAALSALVGSAAAFPGLLNLDDKGPLLDLTGKGGLIDLSKLVNLTNSTILDFQSNRSSDNKFPAADPKNCPVNHDHKPAAKWNSDFPYNYAKNGLPGKGKGGYVVPAPDDEDHKFIHPKETDIRGPYVVLEVKLLPEKRLTMTAADAPA